MNLKFDDFIPILSKVLDIRSENTHCRANAYDKIWNCFNDHYKQVNDPFFKKYMAISLYAYLGNWGMLRNSVLLYSDYECLIDSIDYLCEKKSLIVKNNGCTPEECFKIYTELDRILKEINVDGKQLSVTPTLKTKIMLGVLGIIPAVDTQFRASMKHFRPETKTTKPITIEIISFLQDCINENKEAFETIKTKYNLPECYTDMKLLDLYFWEKNGNFT